MHKRNLLLIVLLAGAAALFLAAGIYAGTTVPDVVKMENPAYEKHAKGIVEFSHRKHINEYKAGCGECHHDADGKALDDLKEGDEVQSCIECHQKPSEMTKAEKKTLRDQKVPKPEQKIKKLAYHAEALHYNCRDCHKRYNKENSTKAAPTTCSKCHPKKTK